MNRKKKPARKLGTRKLRKVLASPMEVAESPTFGKLSDFQPVEKETRSVPLGEEQAKALGLQMPSASEALVAAFDAYGYATVAALDVYRNSVYEANGALRDAVRRFAGF